MIPHPPKLVNLMTFLFAFILCLSCSKDADLLADYVVADSQSVFVEIKVVALVNEQLVIAPIVEGNDEIIAEVTDPSMGTAVINEDNTITYTPNSDATGTDEFDYSTTEQTGTITVTTVNSKVDFWQTKFDLKFEAGGDKAKMLALSKSGNKFQDYYYMYYYFDGLLNIWQATGDNYYLNLMLEVVDNTIKDAKPVNFNSSYLGWPADNSYSVDYPKNGAALWESYYWKGVATLLRILHKSPQLLSTSYKNGTYQDSYGSILAFTEKNIWEKWETKGSSNLYRSHTHMASHWARIGMELYIITGKSKYKEVFDNISFGQIPGFTTNLRDVLKPNVDVPGAYTWEMPFNGGKIQDASHAADIVGFWILSEQNGMYWDEAHINSLIITLDEVIFTNENAPRIYYNVDGSGGNDTWGRLRDWLKLGRYNRPLQDKLINNYQNHDKNSRNYGSLNLGIFALNERILDNGHGVYPENK